VTRRNKTHKMKLKVNTANMRTVEVNGQKAYCVSDLIDCAGMTPVNTFKKDGAVFMSRVTVGGVTRNRQLVNVDDVDTYNLLCDQTAVKTVEVTQQNITGGTSVKVVNTNDQIAEEIQTDVMHDITAARALPTPPKFNLEEVRNHISSPEETAKRNLKSEINKLVHKEAMRQMNAKQITPQQEEENDRYEHRTAYKALYAQFDRIMRIELGKQGYTLEECGLGKAKNYSGTTYIDRITNAGYLENLHIVAQAMFEQK